MTLLESSINFIKQYKPRSVEELRKAGFRLRKIGDGSFRDVYSFQDLPLIIKFPKIDGDFHYTETLKHSRIEYKTWNRVMRSTGKWRILQPYMPSIYYFDKKYGIILVHKYRKSYKRSEWLDLEELVISLSKTKKYEYASPDVDNPGNVGVDEDGNLKIIDLGCFE